jgi:hypothetical protein
MYRLNPTKVSAVENETSLTIDHYTQTFCCYTTSAKVARMLERQFKEYYSLAPDEASATANDVPVQYLCKLHLSSLK